jgi:hypothetical protein
VEHLEVAARDRPGSDPEMMRLVKATARSAARSAGAEEVPAGLSWTAFGERYFPERRRHDFDVLRAYAKYVAAEK